MCFEFLNRRADQEVARLHRKFINCRGRLSKYEATKHLATDFTDNTDYFSDLCHPCKSVATSGVPSWSDER